MTTADRLPSTPDPLDAEALDFNTRVIQAAVRVLQIPEVSESVEDYLLQTANYIANYEDVRADRFDSSALENAIHFLHSKRRDRRGDRSRFLLQQHFRILEKQSAIRRIVAAFRASPYADNYTDSDVVQLLWWINRAERRSHLIDQDVCITDLIDEIDVWKKATARSPLPNAWFLLKKSRKAIGSVVASDPDLGITIAFTEWVCQQADKSLDRMTLPFLRRHVTKWPYAREILPKPNPVFSPKVTDPNLLASASLIETRELVSKYPFRSGSIFLGRTVEHDVIQIGNLPETQSAPLGHVGEGHALCIADTRFGKLVRFLQPTVGTWSGSLFAIDNSGEFASLNAARRGKGDQYTVGMGQKVYVLDPNFIATVPKKVRARWNPLDTLKIDDPELIDKAEDLAEALIPDEDITGRDTYWEDEGRSFVAAVLIFVATNPYYISQGENNLNTVHRLLSNGENVLRQRLIDEGDFVNEDGESLESVIDAYEFLLSQMKDYLSCVYVANEAESLAQILAGAEKQFTGIRSQANASLKWVQKERMRDSLSASDFSIDDLKRKKKGVSVFVCIKNMSRDWRWARLLTTAFLNSQRDPDPKNQANKPHGTATTQQTLAVIDEFPQLRAMPKIIEMLDTIAKNSVRVMIVAQSLTQLRKRYPQDWERFWDAADMRWIFGAEGHFLRDYLVKELGEKEIIRTLENWSEAIGRTETQTEGKGLAFGETNGTSSGTNENDGWSHGKSEGEQSGRSRNQGRGLSYKEGIFEKLPLINKLPFLKQATKSRNWSDGTSEGTNSSKTNGTNGSKGTNEGITQSHQVTYNWNGSISVADQTTSTHGRSQSLHKRPLIEASELPRVIGEVDDPNDPNYPGLALVSLRNGRRFLVRTTYYYADPIFYRTYGKHPRHPFVTAIPWYEHAALEYKEERLWEQIKERAKRECEATKRKVAHVRPQAKPKDRPKLESSSDAEINFNKFMELSTDQFLTLHAHVRTLEYSIEVQKADLREIIAGYSGGRTVKYSDPNTPIKFGQPILRLDGFQLVHAPHDGHLLSVVSTDSTITFTINGLLPPIMPTWLHELHKNLRKSQFFSDYRDDREALKQIVTRFAKRTTAGIEKQISYHREVAKDHLTRALDKAKKYNAVFLGNNAHKLRLRNKLVDIVGGRPDELPKHPFENYGPSCKDYCHHFDSDNPRFKRWNSKRALHWYSYPERPPTPKESNKPAVDENDIYHVADPPDIDVPVIGGPPSRDEKIRWCGDDVDSYREATDPLRSRPFFRSPWDELDHEPTVEELAQYSPDEAMKALLKEQVEEPEYRF